MPENLALYLHIPFCDTKCSYCDFNSYAGMESLIPPYTTALCCELRLWSPLFAGDSVRTVFFGGGTPSLLPVAEMERTVDTIQQSFRLARPLEMSLEANPGTVDLAYLRALRTLGFNRLSLGVQSFDDGELKALDRIHTSEEAITAFKSARAAGFEDVNLDLIFGLANQTLDGWRRNVEHALSLRPEHLSLYALTVEEGTALAASVARGRAPEPDADLQAAMYELSQERLAGAGYRQYEISNWALPGHACRHNVTYWQNGRWLGAGAGAHSSFERCRFANARAPRGYIEHVSRAVGIDATLQRDLPAALAGFPQVVWQEPIDAAMAISDTAILGLRLLDGISLTAFQRRHGLSLLDAFGEAIGECVDLGLLLLEADTLRLSQRGLLLANEVFARLLPDACTLPAGASSS